MNCPKCNKSMQKAMFVEYHLCTGCDVSIEFTWKDKQAANIWRFKRDERMREQVRRDLIDGKIGWKKEEK